MKRVAAALLVTALAACAQLTGVADLSVDDRPRRPGTSSTSEAGPGEEEEETDATTPADTSTVAPDANTNPTPIDSGTDSAPPPCTALPTNETFAAALGAPWIARGVAAAANPGVRLTPSTGGVTGGIYWDAPFTFDRFEVAFSYAITTDPASSTYGPGDGIAFAWISAAAAPDVVLNNGGGLGVYGLTGWAVAIDPYQNGEYMDPATPNIAIKNTTNMSTVAATAANMTLIDGKTHVVRVRLDNGTVTVMLDGAEAIGPTALPGYTAFSGYFGFTAATGGAFEDHKIVSVTARIGKTGACAAP